MSIDAAVEKIAQKAVLAGGASCFVLFVVVLLAAASALSDLNALANMESYQKQADLSYTCAALE